MRLWSVLISGTALTTFGAAATAAQAGPAAQPLTPIQSDAPTSVVPTPAVAVRTASAQAQPQPSTAGDTGDIIVTATRSAESIQRVPIAIEAIDAKTIKSQNIQNFQDYVSHLPGVSFAGTGPGQNDVYIRGIASNKIGVQLSGAQGTVPNVALYLDDQPVTMTGRNLDIYVTDLERIEVLSGPQGTLFGASSQAGNVRLITHKPDLDKWEAGVTMGASVTEHGSPSNSVEGYVNVPLIDGVAALRVAAYNSHDGGYIDNVSGSQTLSPYNPYYPGKGATYDAANNTPLVRNDFNTDTYRGVRIGLKVEPVHNWSALIQFSHQDLTTDGVFAYDPDVGDLQVQRYYPDHLDDKFDQVSWNIDGKIGPLDVIYTGGYLHRTAFQTMDYTSYGNVGPFIPYYVCNAKYTHCSDPTLGYIGHIDSERWNHELRISTPKDWRLRFTVGVYHDSSKTTDQGDFDYPASTLNGFVQNGPIPGSTESNPNLRAPGIQFINDYTSRSHQLSFFGEASFDILRDLLTVTGGLRRYHLVYSLDGSTSFGNRYGPGLYGRNIDQLLSNVSPKSENGTVPRFTLTLTPSQRLLFYATYSRGFRPGGFNRGYDPNPAKADSAIPETYVSDKIINYEAGWKTTFLHGLVRWNGTAYLMNWNNMQLTTQNVGIAQLFYTYNAANSRIKGVESDFTISPTRHIQVTGAVSYNDTRLTKILGNPILAADVVPVGSRLSQAPVIQTNLRARYSWAIADNTLYTEIGGQTASSSYSSLDREERQKQAPYGVLNLSAGITHGKYSAILYANNITDKRADLYDNSHYSPRDANGNAITSVYDLITTNRPRTIGLKISVEM
ncbi:TonB-dependent receptor [Sphingomonas bacterium]|uniref:TonB-dependent receptor n=1 Tax=Sphingomonas bacterium TaxID=1895847 RepID=UPI0015771DBC|nr:TonB-dependent receptor [Sphingomonas bacterium]